MSQDSEKQESLKIGITSAFRHTIEEIMTSIQHNDDDITTKQFVIAYNKKSDRVEILKMISIDNKEIVLEPPIWTSYHSYNSLNYDSGTKDRITIIKIPAQMPDIQGIIRRLRVSQNSDFIAKRQSS